MNKTLVMAQKTTHKLENRKIAYGNDRKRQSMPNRNQRHEEREKRMRDIVPVIRMENQKMFAPWRGAISFCDACKKETRPECCGCCPLFQAKTADGAEIVIK